GPRGLVLEVAPGGLVGPARPREAPVGARLRPAEPVPVRHPQLAPLVGRLDVVVKREAVREVLLRLVVLAHVGPGQGKRAVGRGFLVAVTELEAELETGLRLVVRLLSATEK